ncbi:MAG: hypothetical protein H0W96_05095 [Solirubrobacterales bacterium]|nr:hypothetical protein [Solirubrobacterales bacterium]
MRACFQAPDRAERVSELADLAAVGELEWSAVRHATRQEQRVAKLIEASDPEVGHGSTLRIACRVSGVKKEQDVADVHRRKIGV